MDTNICEICYESIFMYNGECLVCELMESEPESFCVICFREVDLLDVFCEECEENLEKIEIRATPSIAPAA